MSSTQLWQWQNRSRNEEGKGAKGLGQRSKSGEIEDGRRAEYLNVEADSGYWRNFSWLAKVPKDIRIVVCQS